MNKGYINLHRKLLDSGMLRNHSLFTLWVYCLLKANHKPNTFIWNGEHITIQRGQFISGRKEIAKELNMNESCTYRNLKKLEKLGNVNIKSNNKFSLITICKYNTYQTPQVQSEQHFEQQVNNKRTTSEQQVNTNNNDKNDNNEKKELGASEKKSFVTPNQLKTIEECVSVAEYEGYKKEEGEKFFHYYNAQGWKRGGSGLVITDLVSAFRSWIIKGEQNKQPIAKETWEERHLKKLNSQT